MTSVPASSALHSGTHVVFTHTRREPVLARLLAQLDDLVARRLGLEQRVIDQLRQVGRDLADARAPRRRASRRHPPSRAPTTAGARRTTPQLAQSSPGAVSSLHSPRSRGSSASLAPGVPFRRSCTRCGDELDQAVDVADMRATIALTHVLGHPERDVLLRLRRAGSACFPCGGPRFLPLVGGLDPLESPSATHEPGRSRRRRPTRRRVSSRRSRVPANDRASS